MVVEFYKNELTNSKSIIDEEYHDEILRLLKKRKLNGEVLEEINDNIKEFKKKVFGKSNNGKNKNKLFQEESKKNIIINELSKNIQLFLISKKVKDIIPKYEIAKKIQKLRITYFDQGGRECLHKHETLSFGEDISYYQHILSKWRFYHYRWKLEISNLRIRYPVLTYFTVNDMRFICENVKFYNYCIKMTNLSESQTFIQKLTNKFAFIRRIQDDEVEEMIIKWQDLDSQTISLYKLYKFIQDTFKISDKELINSLNQDETIQLQKSINIYIELHQFCKYEENYKQYEKQLNDLINKILQTFNIFNKSFTINDTKKLLQDIEPFDEMILFRQLGQYLKKEFELNIDDDDKENDQNDDDNDDQINLISREDTMQFEQETQHKNIRLMISGKPHLYLVDDSDLILSRLIKLFSEFNQEIRASQVLFCTNNTTLEEIMCFVSRSCYHSQDYQRNLYCLVQPENLRQDITDEILSILLQKLRESDARFTIITVDKTNKWFQELSIYQDELNILTDQQSKEFFEKYIISFETTHRQSNNTNNPVCVVFMAGHSETQCVGKTYQINKTCKRFALECVHIPFNSPKLDIDFIVDRLCLGEQRLNQKRKEGTLKNNKIVFHLNVSSSCGKDINILIFQLLILRYITKSDGNSFVVRPHHVFFIELPLFISNTFSTKRNGIESVKKHFYFMAGRNSYLHKDIIKMNVNKYNVSNEDQFVLRYLDALYKTIENSKTNNKNRKNKSKDTDCPLKIVGPKNQNAKQWDFNEHENISMSRAKELIKYFTNKTEENGELNFVFLKSYLSFLYRQLIQLYSSPILIQNDLAVDVNTGIFRSARYIQFHRIIASSFAKMASSFACENYQIQDPFANITDDTNDEIKNEDNDDDEDETKKGDDDETKGDETFNLVNTWSVADPPLVFLNQASDYNSNLNQPNLKKDLDFQSIHATQTFTILSKNLSECKHQDSEEWKLFKQTIVSVKKIDSLRYDEFDFNANEGSDNYDDKEEKKKEIKIIGENENEQKLKLRLLLRLCGGFKKYDEAEKKFKPIMREEEKDKFVDKLYEDNKDYALTFDNILKIVAIFFRLQSGKIPVLIMGETGCGKTRLLKYMSDILSLEMEIVDVHGGYTLKDLSKDIKRASDRATSNETSTVLLFLDEINTSEEIASFKEIICDHSFRGQKLPNNLIVIGALNPYRRRKLSKNEREIQNEDMKNNKTFYKNSFEKKISQQLVYKVYPLPHSMKYYVWNFGTLNVKNESQYIFVITTSKWHEILKQEKFKSLFEKYFEKYIPIFAKLIQISMKLLREWLNDVSVVSLRDVQRANKFFSWFFQQFKNDNTIGHNNRIIKSIIMSLSQCFYYRLQSNFRTKYENMISNQLNKLDDVIDKSAVNTFQSHNFRRILLGEQERYLDILNIPRGIALNRSFRENIFIILVGIVTKTPTIIVGRPGSSKTLSVNVLETNLSPISKNKNLTDLNIDSYVFQHMQCSKLTTSSSIHDQWKHAEMVQNYEEASKRVLFLDEMGLAEKSNKKPLKILHKLLEDPKISFIGLSNWTLDSAKMNRVILHNVIPIHKDPKDLRKTITELAKNAYGKEVTSLNNKLSSLVKFYKNLIDKQNSTNNQSFPFDFHFFGLRDLYSMIGYLKNQYNVFGKKINSKLMIEAICRNFNGMKESDFDKHMFELILSVLDLDDDDNNMNSDKFKEIIWNEMTAINLIDANIKQSQQQYLTDKLDYESRHILLISDSEIVWQYLYELSILQHHKSRVIFGSKFKNDTKSTLHLHQNIEKIKNAMSSGHTVVLLHLDQLYESLYDVLNQRYTKIGKKRFCNITIRNETIKVEIHPSFRFIIVIPTINAHHTSKNENDHTPVAFLNRLEKQYLSLKNLISSRKNWDQLLHRLQFEIQDIFTKVNNNDYSSCFAGFVPTLTFSSVLIYAEKQLFGSIHQPSDEGIEMYDTDDDDDKQQDEDKKDDDGNDDDDDDDDIDENDPDTQIINYAIALLLSNCYLRHFISYKDLSLHKRLKPLRRDRGFSSIVDVMNYYYKQLDLKNVQLIRISTHDHFCHVSDFRKHFHIKRKIDSYKLISRKTIGSIVQDLVLTDLSFDKTTLNEIESDAKIDEKEEDDKENAILINIGDIVSSSEFIAEINEFLIDKEYHKLIIQTTNKNNDEFLHNLHIQYLIEQAKHNKNNDIIAKKQIIIVIYMNRIYKNDKIFNNEDNDNFDDNDAEIAQFIQSQQYPLIFNGEWNQVYCDAVLPSNIKITDLNINDAISSNLFEIRLSTHTEAVIQSTFEMALNNIRFPARMRIEVDRISKIFSDPHDKQLKNAIITRIQQSLSSSNNLDAIKKLIKKLFSNNAELEERGPFRGILLSQISRQMKEKLVEILIVVLNHHSSQLFWSENINNRNPRQLSILRDSVSLRANNNNLMNNNNNMMNNDDGNNNVNESERESRIKDIWMKQMFLILLQHKSGIVRLINNNTNNINNNTNVEIKLRVEFPFSPYIDSYFHHIQNIINKIANKKDYFKTNADIDINESGKIGQEIMIPIIENHLKTVGLDDCLLAINKYIEWYVFDVAVLEIQKQTGNRYSNYFKNSLISFIQQFVLCCTHQIHHKFEKNVQNHNMLIALKKDEQENKNKDDKNINENDEEEYVMDFHESDDDDDDEQGGMMMNLGNDDTDDDQDDDKDTDDDDSDSNSDSDQSSQKSDDDDDDDNQEDDEEDDVEEDAVVSSDDNQQEPGEIDKDSGEEDEARDEVKELEESSASYGIHEVHAAIWCNEVLLKHLMNMMNILEMTPEKLDDIVKTCWIDYKNIGLLNCVFKICNKIISHINDQFRNSDSLMFKILMNEIIAHQNDISYVLHWLKKEHFNIDQLFTLNTKWQIIKIIIVCYKPFEKYQDGSSLRTIKTSLQSLFERFRTSDNDNFNDDNKFCNVDTILFLNELMNNICDKIKQIQNKQNIINFVVSTYIVNFAFDDMNNIVTNEQFIFYLISLMSYDIDSDEENKNNNNNSNNNQQFIADSYTKQEIATKILTLISMNDEQDILNILHRINDSLNESNLLSSVILRAAENEQHSKWIKKSKKNQIPKDKHINEAVKQLKNSQKKSYLHQLLAIAKCKMIIHFAISNMKKYEDSYLKLLAKMFILSKSSKSSKNNENSTQFQSLIKGLGFYFFAELWRQKGSIDACKLLQKKYNILNLKHLTVIDNDTKKNNNNKKDDAINKTRYKYLDDNIFYLLTTNNKNTLKSFKASKLGKSLNATFNKLQTSLNIYKDNKDDNKVNNDDNNDEKSDNDKDDRFKKISNEMFIAFNKNKEMSSDLILESYEIIHLIGSIFNVIYLNGGKCDDISSLENIYIWLRNQSVIETPSRLHCVIGQLLKNDFPSDSLLKYDLNKTAPPLEQMLRIRLSWHLLGVVNSFYNKSLNPFYILFNNPLFYQNGFLIGMPESQQMSLFKAMQGHAVYICPNKHLYFVANCGKTKETGKCYQCNSVIGNERNKRQHNTASGNKKLGIIGANGEIIPDTLNNNDITNHNDNDIEPQQIPSQYIAVGYIDSNGNDDCVRCLTQLAVYIIRVYILCILLLHHSLYLSEEYPSKCKQFMYPYNFKDINDSDVSSTIHDSIKKYIKKIQKKLGISIEETFYILHGIIHKMYLEFDKIYIDKNKRASKDIESRHLFEAFFMDRCVEPILQNLNKTITNIRGIVSLNNFKKYWSKRIDITYDEKLNKKEIELKKNFINKYSPYLFLPFRHITLSTFRSYVLNNGNPELYPIIFGIIDTLDNIGTSLFAIQHLPSMIKFMKLVHSRLSGRITKKDINQIDLKTQEYKYNAKWLLDKCQDDGFGDIKSLNNALIGFVNGWNHIARRVTTNESQQGAKMYRDDDDDDDKDNYNYNNDEEKEELLSIDLQEYARRIVIRNECKTVPITMIEPKDPKVGILPNEVPLKLCINCIDGAMDSSLMIQGILDHLIAANRAVLQFCKQYDDEDLYLQKNDFINMINITRNTDVCDFSESELLSVLQYCTQQSLTYYNNDIDDIDNNNDNTNKTTFEMNLQLLETKLYERYIIGRKLIISAKDELKFIFSGHYDIKSYVDKINFKFVRNNSNNNDNDDEKVSYFENCSKQLLDKLSLNIRIKTDSRKFNNNSEKNEYELKYINNAKKGIEQVLIALYRFPSQPNKNTKILKFMKENSLNSKEEYQLFESMKNDLLLKHCYSIYLFLSKRITLKQGKWSDIKEIENNISDIFCKKISDKKILVDLQNIIDSNQSDDILEFLIEWKEFMQNILITQDHIKHSNQTSLIIYLQEIISNTKILDNFPKQIMLSHCVFAYDVAAKQFKKKAKVL